MLHHKTKTHYTTTNSIHKKKKKKIGKEPLKAFEKLCVATMNSTDLILSACVWVCVMFVCVVSTTR